MSNYGRIKAQGVYLKKDGEGATYLRKVNKILEHLEELRLESLGLHFFLL